MTPPSAAELQEILKRAHWVRALAARLVDDRDAADDLAQDACVAALTERGRARSAEAWLSGVVRNLARRRRRGEARRTARERAAARPLAAGETGELVLQAELQARVIQAVTALDEPYRTTVLLRFFEGLSLIEIGERMGVPASTARTRLARALDRLRERFDREHGGDRAAWCAALLRLAGPELQAAAAGAAGATAAAGTGVLSGVLAMSAWMKAAAAAAVIVVGVVGWRAMGSDGRAIEPLIESNAATSSAEPAEPALPSAELAAAPAAERSERAQAVPEEAPERPAAAPAAQAAEAKPEHAPARVEARLVDEQGHGIAGGVVRARQNRDLDLPTDPMKRSGAGGEVVLEVPMSFSSSTAVVVATAPDRATAYALTRLESGSTTHLGELVLGPGCVLTGRVTDVSGNGVDGAFVFIDAVESQRTDPEEMRRLGPRNDESPLHATRADDQGRYRLAATPAGPARVWAQSDGFAFTWTDPIEIVPGDNPPIDLTLHVLAADDVIQGIVLSPDDEPVPFAQIGIVFAQGNSQTSTSNAADAEGRFRLTVSARVPHHLTVSDPKDRWASVALGAIEPGSPELVVRFRETPKLEFEVVDEAGDPVEFFEVELLAEGDYDRLGGVWPAKHKGGKVTLPAPSQRFRVEVNANGFKRAALGPFAAEAELATTRVVLVALPGVAGRVLSAGEPVSGAAVTLEALLSDEQMHMRNGLRCLFTSSGRSEVVPTDAEGRFRVFPARAGKHLLRAEIEGRAPAELELELDPERAVSGLELVLGAGGAIEGRVLVPAGLEAEGRIIALNHGDGRGRTLRVGPDGRYRVEGLAVGGWQVLAVDEEILPNRQTSWMGPNPKPGPIEWSCQVFEGKTTHYDVDLRERAGGRLVGRLALGVDAEGWTAALRRFHPMGHEPEVALDVLAADGSFELAYPEPGTYRLVVLSPPGAARLELRATVKLEAVETQWEHELTLGSIAGSIESPAPSAVHQYRFTGVAPSSHGETPEIIARFEPAGDGAFRLPFVPAGQGVLEAVGSGDSETLKTVSVHAGQELTVELP